LSEIVLAVRRQKAWPSASAFLHAVAPIDVVSAGLVVDDESLTGSFLESLTQCTGKHIDRPSRREGNDQSYRLPRKILGAGSSPREQERTSGGEQPRAGFGQHRLLPSFRLAFLRGLPSVRS
jgi:hypothetical protein